MASLHPVIEKAFDTDLRTEYESTEELKALYEDIK